MTLNAFENTIAIISGGFDPLHKGHINLIEEAARIGQVVVLLNSDEWLERKKGYYFMDWDERCIIMGSLRFVTLVIDFNDQDDSVIKGLQKIQSMYPRKHLVFVNGGDRNKDNIPEKEFCDRNGIDLVFGAGGKKVQSSSKLVDRLNSNNV